MLRELSTDPYVPMTGSLPANADESAALAYIERQRHRLAASAGYPFCVALRSDDSAVGTVGLWLDENDPTVATAGYSTSPRHRGRGYAASALLALADFAGGLPNLHRIDLYIESWNSPSLKTAGAAGFRFVAPAPHRRTSGGPRVDMLLYSLALRSSY
jgi:RimJ/RimL family protein N-acetyltransferase